MTSLIEHFHKGMVLALVQRHIFCPFAPGVILDVDTCVVVLDADGDPTIVMSPEAYKALVRIADENGVEPLRNGLTFDAKTLPA